MPYATGAISAPSASQSAAISFINETLSARSAFDAYLMSIASRRPVTSTGASNGANAAARVSRLKSSSAPITMRDGCSASYAALPWERNSGTAAMCNLGAASASRQANRSGGMVDLTATTHSRFTDTATFLTAFNTELVFASPSGRVGVPVQTNITSKTAHKACGGAN
ncbi:hypothetical protein SDC9_104310 [bioreactor metagenome]|uniref:Uncharacterized protein n=1 Tax=bioreactor metagenome TaxID=1076179 RepID=A0A645AXJ4_9ZZZZ